ncbi:MAG: LON peptidase substrate-binding domain-containing protein [Gammaproteobacteria bacterium]|nr:LON peptidase substrate-binding domain-containing protein [Gammaproteobacteria bacterium]
MASSEVTPIFPLHTVLFPGGLLPLRIFEPRYIDMIRNCLRNNSQFGICLISDGEEVGGGATTTHDVGTLASIHDWHTRQDGLLGITVLGEQRINIEKAAQQPNRLITASVHPFDAEPAEAIPSEYMYLVDMCRDIIDQVSYRYLNMPKNYEDATWLGFRLAELLPMKLSQKQYFLQLTDPIVRLERLAALLKKLKLK